MKNMTLFSVVIAIALNACASVYYPSNDELRTATARAFGESTSNVHIGQTSGGKDRVYYDAVINNKAYKCQTKPESKKGQFDIICK